MAIPCNLIAITPACAGRSRRHHGKRFFPRDHPRVRGEKFVCSMARSSGKGSPLRARGEVVDGEIDVLEFRITPACAGRSFSAFRPRRPGEDHPRVRGEKQAQTAATNAGQGSPPRARGEGLRGGKSCVLARITPACAGRRRFGSPRGPRSGDHPRVCGEKKDATVDLSVQKGSPPRVRGEDVGVEPKSFALRITPACAGRSATCGQGRFRCSDHPRVCGEKGCRPIDRTSVRGSPPRVRGEARRILPHTVVARITPACAGRSHQITCFLLSCTDHPRVRGEKAAGRYAGKDQGGSPPRARGEASPGYWASRS